MTTCVVAVIATYRRPLELSRLLASLDGVEAVFVWNNGADAEVRAACAAARFPAICIDSAENLGCGAGLRGAEEQAWQRFGDRLTHLLVLDDDAVVSPGSVSSLVDVMERERAAAVYPLVVGPDDCVGWTPGLTDRTKHRLGRAPIPVAEYRSQLGSPIADFDWAQGICLLVSRKAIEAAGFHRSDFWVRGEDLDFSLRLTALGRGVFATEVVVKHSPPENSSVSNGPAEYLRHAAMLQNIAYLSFRQAHGRRIAHSIPGASRRFLATWGWKALPDLFRTLWRGAMRGEPAGTGHGRTFRARFEELVAR